MVIGLGVVGYCGSTESGIEIGTVRIGFTGEVMFVVSLKGGLGLIR